MTADQVSNRFELYLVEVSTSVISHYILLVVHFVSLYTCGVVAVVLSQAQEKNKKSLFKISRVVILAPCTSIVFHFNRVDSLAYSVNHS